MKSYKWPIMIVSLIVALTLVDFFSTYNLQMVTYVNGEEVPQEDPYWLLTWRFVFIFAVGALWSADIWFYNKRQKDKVKQKSP